MQGLQVNLDRAAVHQIHALMHYLIDVPRETSASELPQRHLRTWNIICDLAAITQEVYPYGQQAIDL